MFASKSVATRRSAQTAPPTNRNPPGRKPGGPFSFRPAPLSRGPRPRGGSAARPGRARRSTSCSDSASRRLPAGPAWRKTFARLPPFPASMPKLQQRAATANEYALYALLLAQPLTGLGQTIFRGAPFQLGLWRTPALTAANHPLAAAFGALHEWGATALSSCAHCISAPPYFTPSSLATVCFSACCRVRRRPRSRRRKGARKYAARADGDGARQQDAQARRAR